MKLFTRGLVAGTIALASMAAFATPAHAAIYCEKTFIPDQDADDRVFLYICVNEDLQNASVYAEVEVNNLRVTGASVSRNTDPIAGTDDLRVCVFYVFRGEERELCHTVPLTI